MEKIILSFNLVCFILFLSAQTTLINCGNSGASQCTPSGSYTQAGLYPSTQNLPPIINNQVSTTTIEVYVPTVFNGTTISSVKIKSISVPYGLCWSSNVTNDIFSGGTTNCIKINGVACARPGQYELKIVVNVNGVPTDIFLSSLLGSKYFVRVVNVGQVAQAVNLAQTDGFVSYNNTDPICDINDITSLRPLIFCGGDSTILVGKVIPSASYQWYFGSSSLIPNATSNMVTAYQTGYYDLHINVNGAVTIATSPLVEMNPRPNPTISGNSNCQLFTDYSFSASSGYSSYVWQAVGGTIVDGQGTSFVTVQWDTTMGAKLTLSAFNGSCGNSTEIPINLILGINNDNELSNYVNIRYSSSQNLLILSMQNTLSESNYSVYDMIGKSILSGVIDNSKEKLVDVSHLPRGVYSVKVGSGIQNKKFRFVVE